MRSTSTSRPRRTRFAPTFGGALATQFDTDQRHQVRSGDVSAERAAGRAIEIHSDSDARELGKRRFTSATSPRSSKIRTTPLMTRTNRQTVIHVSANIAPGGVALERAERVSAAPRRAASSRQECRSFRTARRSAAELSRQTVGGIGIALIALVDARLSADGRALRQLPSCRSSSCLRYRLRPSARSARSAITQQTLNLFSLIGTVLLIGLVSKNGILLVDFANHRVRAGVDRSNAIRESARERFRPIIMTTTVDDRRHAAARARARSGRRAAPGRSASSSSADSRARCCSRSCSSRSRSCGSRRRYSELQRRATPRDARSRAAVAGSRSRVEPDGTDAALRPPPDARLVFCALVAAGRRDRRRTCS